MGSSFSINIFQFKERHLTENLIPSAETRFKSADNCAENEHEIEE